MGWMKKTLLAAIAILSVGSVAVPVATALTINIDDRTEGGEVLTVSGINLPGLFMAANFLIVVSDPGTTNVSDIISVVVTPHATSATTNFDIVFTSDNEIPLAAPAPPPFWRYRTVHHRNRVVPDDLQ